MNELQCNYELRKELFTRLENKTLQDMVIPTAITAMSEIKMQGSIDEEKKQPNTFNMMRNSKINAPNSSRSFPIVDRIQAKSFKHMRSILGHISVIENNIINPVPIYCVTYSTDNQLIFTGDNNG